MEFAITAGPPADDSYRTATIFVGELPLKDLLAISLAAIVGANLRYLLSRLAVREFGPVFPYGTLFINVVGSFIVGFFVIWTTERVLVDPRWRLLVVVGFCGSFTTFSSYAFETMSLFEHGQWGLMLANIFSNNLLCLGGALAGMAVARGL
jgi:fluoride exporter